MEYQVNQEFESNGKRYRCEESADPATCNGCSFDENGMCAAWDLDCNGMVRNDHKDVVFVEVSK